MSDNSSLSMLDWADSFYIYVKRRVQASNPTRKFGGIVQARAWPLKSIDYGAFYLLLAQMTPTSGQNSWSSPSYGEKVQWTWQLDGSDLTNNIAANRGDRYRLHKQMVQEILSGMFPGFCQKFSWTTDNAGNLVSMPFNPSEFIWYSLPDIADTYDASKGILTGGASTVISAFGPTLS